MIKVMALDKISNCNHDADLHIFQIDVINRSRLYFRMDIDICHWKRNGRDVNSITCSIGY